MFIIRCKFQSDYIISENSFLTDYYCFYLFCKMIKSEKGSMKHEKCNIRRQKVIIL